MKHLAIITTHPIQYNAPWFRLLSERGKIAVKVFYTWSQTENNEKFDPGFGKSIEWDIPLLDGYDYTFVKNVSKNPGSKSFRGIDNPTLIEEINEWSPDAILIFGWKFKSHFKVLRYFRGKIPVLFRGDSTLLNEQSGWKKVIRRRVLKNVFRYVDFALYVGAENKRYFKAAGLKENQMVFVPHAVDNDRFRDTEVVDIPNWPSKCEGKIVFLYAGKLEPVKNIALLLGAFDALSSDAMLMVVGNGPLEKDLKREYARNKNIHFLGFQNQGTMPSLYKKADVFVLPSKSETWGLGVNEAMACSKPVLVSDQCGCAVDLIENGKNGYIFQSGDMEDLKDKIEMMIQNKNNLNKMGAYSYQKIQDWSFEKIVEAIEKLVNGS